MVFSGYVLCPMAPPWRRPIAPVPCQNRTSWSEDGLQWICLMPHGPTLAEAHSSHILQKQAQPLTGYSSAGLLWTSSHAHYPIAPA